VDVDSDYTDSEEEEEDDSAEDTEDGECGEGPGAEEQQGACCQGEQMTMTADKMVYQVYLDPNGLRVPGQSNVLIGAHILTKFASLLGRNRWAQGRAQAIPGPLGGAGARSCLADDHEPQPSFGYFPNLQLADGTDPGFDTEIFDQVHAMMNDQHVVYAGFGVKPREHMRVAGGQVLVMFAVQVSGLYSHLRGRPAHAHAALPDALSEAVCGSSTGRNLWRELLRVRMQGGRHVFVHAALLTDLNFDDIIARLVGKLQAGSGVRQALAELHMPRYTHLASNITRVHG
jgi:hypothetical protein